LFYISVTKTHSTQQIELTVLNEQCLYTFINCQQRGKLISGQKGSDLDGCCDREMKVTVPK